MAIDINYTSYSFRSSYSPSKQCGRCESQPKDVDKATKEIPAPSVTVSLSQASFSASNVQNVAPVAEVSAESRAPNNPYASTILNAINGQLALDAANGDDTEQLQSRLGAGLQGFLKGFDEAFEQLSAMSEFSGEIKLDVLATKEQVLNGLLDTAKQLGLDDSAIQDELLKLSEQKNALNSNSEATKPDSSFPSVHTIGSLGSALSAQQNTFKFELLTKDGDKIDILVSALKASEQTKTGNGYNLQNAEKNQFSLSIDGELDADELKAINELLNQVGNISEAFYQGNVEQAFDQAMSMGYDASEISSFAVKLTQSSVTQVKGYSEIPNTYAEQNDNQKPQLSKNLVHLGSFIKALESGQLMAEEMGQSSILVTELADKISNRGHHQQDISAFVERLTLKTH